MDFLGENRVSDYRFPANELRTLLAKAIPEELAVFGSQMPAPRNLYVPTIHARALHPDTMLVVGIRGSGKSFWWTALQSAEHRRLVANCLQRAEVNDNTRISPGFGAAIDPNNFPGKIILAKLLEDYEPRDIWRAIVIRHVLGNASELPANDWRERIVWIKDNPENVERALYKADQDLYSQQQKHLILFDALDRTADDWPTMRRLLKGLLQVLLEFRDTLSIRPKAFVRPEMMEDPQVRAFPDASKVLNNKVELIWPTVDLYGLLWQYLANEREHGEVFRKGCREGFRHTWSSRMPSGSYHRPCVPKRRSALSSMPSADHGWGGIGDVGSHILGCQVIWQTRAAKPAREVFLPHYVKHHEMCFAHNRSMPYIMRESNVVCRKRLGLGFVRWRRTIPGYRN